jgi:serine protease Do
MNRAKLFQPTLWFAGLLALLLSTAPAFAQLPDFTNLVKNNAAAVVNISTTREITENSQNQLQHMLPGLPENSPFRQFFKHFYEGKPNGQQKYEERSLGSGFFISKDGYILTNAHVVKGADSIIVKLQDRTEKKAKLVGLDKRTDVALLKISGDNYPTVKIGDSSKLQVGQWVLAIGSPFGLDYTATAGIISALGRNLPSDTYVPFIQTDVAVNPGNSGGPLFDLSGDVIGINSQIYTNTGGFMGLSFAIPIGVAMDVANQIKHKGYVSRGWLGVVIQNVTQDLADSFGLKTPKGALIAQVVPNSPAHRAGLKSGDIILKYNGHPIGDSGSLPPLVGETTVGKTVPLEILRDGKRKTVHVKIAQLPKEHQVAKAHHEKQGSLNILVSNLTAPQRHSLGIDHRGVLVKEVGEGPAADAGIRPGDVILQVNHRDVKNTRELRHIVKELPVGRAVPVLVMRHKQTLFLALKMPKK